MRGKEHFYIIIDYVIRNSSKIVWSEYFKLFPNKIQSTNRPRGGGGGTANNNINRHNIMLKSKNDDIGKNSYFKAPLVKRTYICCNGCDLMEYLFIFLCTLHFWFETPQKSFPLPNTVNKTVE